MLFRLEAREGTQRILLPRVSSRSVDGVDVLQMNATTHGFSFLYFRLVHVRVVYLYSGKKERWQSGDASSLPAK